jgi:hypothetical protein
MRRVAQTATPAMPAAHNNFLAILIFVSRSLRRRPRFTQASQRTRTLAQGTLDQVLRLADRA